MFLFDLWQATYNPMFEDDLEMVVKTLFQRIFSHNHAMITSEEDPLKIGNMWDTYLKPPHWSKLLAYARNLDYENIKKGI